MKLIFGTTNNRKVEDLQNIIDQMKLDIEVVSMKDIGWDRGEIEEDGLTIEENSLIKANAILSFCIDHGINYPILSDDSGLFVDALNGEPGIYTARYADDELEKDKTLPDYQCVIKLLRKMNGEQNRRAKYRCCVTCMNNDGTYFQEFGESNGVITNEINGELKKPYFYSVFILDGTDVVFSELNSEQLSDTYRYSAIKRTLKRF